MENIINIIFALIFYLLFGLMAHSLINAIFCKIKEIKKRRFLTKHGIATTGHIETIEKKMTLK